MATATERKSYHRRVATSLWLSIFLFLQIFTPLQVSAAGLANFQIFAQSTGASSIVSPSRVDGGVKLTYAQGKVYYYSVGRYSTPSFNDSDLTYQSAIRSGFSNGLALSATKIACDASFNIRMYDSGKNKIATLKLIVYNTAGGPCTNEKLADELGEKQIKDDTSTENKGDDGSGTPEKEPEKETEETACDACAVFECPKWDEYMRKIDDIIEKIPPAPDWNKIIGTAQTPAIEDFQKPTKPSTPEQPEGKDILEILDGVDEKNHKKPEMQDNSDDVGDFESLDDVEAPEEEKDESGGFKIVDPLDNLSDGSDAPRPSDETISPPTPSDTSLPTPTPSDETISPPTPSDETLEGPTTDDTLQNPTTDDYLEYPMLEGGG